MQGKIEKEKDMQLGDMSILSKNASLKLVECISNNHAEVVLPLLQGTFVLFQVNLNHNAG